MSDDELAADSRKMTPWQRHRFMVLVAITIAVSLFLVAVSLALYASSGTAQLDLSRPGYQGVRNQAARSDSLEKFPSTGAITQQVIDQFRKLYSDQAEKATNVDSFGGDVMSDKALSLDDK
jgi:hypothetical protein